MSRPRYQWFAAVVRLLRPLSFVALLLIAWHVAVTLQHAPILPGPLAVGLGLLELARARSAAEVLVASLFPGHVGLRRGGGAGDPARTVDRLVPARGAGAQSADPDLRPISPLAWIPIAILWFGVGDLAAIFLIFLASFLPLTVTAMNAVAQHSRRSIVNAGRNFGLLGAAVGLSGAVSRR